MNLLMKRTSIFAMIVIMISLTFMSAFAAETKEEETNYGNWVEVADAMSEHLQKAVEVYKPGDKDAKKAATDAINVAYFKFYEKIGFEKTTMSAISGQRGSMVEHQFYRAKKSIKEDADPKEVKDEIDALITYLHEDAHTLDGTSGDSKSSGQSQEDANSLSTGQLLGELLKRFGTFLQFLDLHFVKDLKPF